MEPRPQVPVGRAEPQIELARVVAAGQTLAIDIRAVREIVRGEPCAALPRAPALIEGVIELRGSVIPVVDLGRLLGGDAGEAGRRTRIVVVEVGELVFGMRVSAAEEVVRVPACQVGPPPALAREAGCDVVGAMVRRDSEPPLPVLSLEALRGELRRAGKRRRGETSARAQ